MKTISLEKMVSLVAGGQNRSCMISGGLATLAFITGSWAVGLAITAGASYYGCFD